MKTFISRGHIRCSACRVTTVSGEQIIEIRGNIRLCPKCADDVVFLTKQSKAMANEANVTIRDGDL